MVIRSMSAYSVRARTVTRPIAPAPPRTMICIRLILISSNGSICTAHKSCAWRVCNTGRLVPFIDNSGERDASSQFEQRIFEAVEDRVDLFAGDDDGRLDAHDTRVVERAGDQYTAFKEARRDGVADIIVDEMLADQQALASN